MFISETPEVASADAARVAALHKEQGANDLNDMFMELLLVQLQQQDPLNPTTNEEFLSQLAQLNSLNELQDLNKNLSGDDVQDQLTRASSMIGQLVRGNDFDQGGEIYGIVGSAKLQSGEVFLNLIGENGTVTGQVGLKDVLEITDPTYFVSPEEEA